MSINKLWLRDQLFARSRLRTIDRDSLIDLLGIVIYEGNRIALLEDAGFADQASSVECLFDYVLDALGIPPASQNFSREPFESLFYADHCLENQFASLDDVLTALEALRDETTSRLAAVKEMRAGIRIVESNKTEG